MLYHYQSRNGHYFTCFNRNSGPRNEYKHMVRFKDQLTAFYIVFSTVMVIAFNSI